MVTCDIISETCPGTGCFKAFNSRQVHFQDYGENTEMIGFFTCGGCPGRRVYRLMKALKRQDVDVVHLSSCMQMENYPECPHVASIKKTIEDAGVRVVEGTHH